MRVVLFNLSDRVFFARSLYRKPFSGSDHWQRSGGAARNMVVGRNTRSALVDDACQRHHSNSHPRRRSRLPILENEALELAVALDRARSRWVWRLSFPELARYRRSFRGFPDAQGHFLNV